MRRDRVSQQMRREIALLLQKGVNDARIGFVTITKVDLSADLRNAKVYLTLLTKNLKERNKSFRGLNSAKGYIAGAIARRMELKYAPRLAFIEDKEQLDSYKIDEILREIETKKDHTPTST